jgi:hypothetical protein
MGGWIHACLEYGLFLSFFTLNMTLGITKARRGRIVTDMSSRLGERPRGCPRLQYTYIQSKSQRYNKRCVVGNMKYI